MSSSRMTIERLTDASPGDVDDVNVLLTELKPAWPAISLADLEAVLASPSRVHVARVDGSIVGLMLLVPHRHFGGLRCHVEDVVVRDTHRRRGIARRLLEAAMADAPLETVSFDLRSHHSREAARALYLDLGFVPSDTTVYRLVVPPAGFEPAHTV